MFTPSRDEVRQFFFESWRKHRERPLISWWDIDMPGEDWLAECRQAMKEGYTDFKTKARPWFDRTAPL